MNEREKTLTEVRTWRSTLTEAKKVKEERGGRIWGEQDPQDWSCTRWWIAYHLENS